MYEWQYVNNNYNNLIAISKAIGDKRVAHVHGSFGDIYFQTAVINEYNCIHENSINIMIDEKYKEFVSKIIKNKKIEIYFVESPKIHNLLSQNNIIGEVNGLPIRMLPTLYPYIAECLYAGKLRYFDFARILIRSNAQGQIKPLEQGLELINEARSILETLSLPIGKTILISCENNTHLEFDEEIWIEIINIIEKYGFTVCVNSSGTLVNGQKFLLDNRFKKLSMPPYLAVTLIEQCGGYIGTSNGLTGIQAYFNHSTPGLHMINAPNGRDNETKDKFGNKIFPRMMGLKEIDSERMSKMQNELYIEHGNLSNQNILDVENFLNKLSDI